MKSAYDQEREDRPRSPMSSMVDIGFLLLIYFLVAATIQPVEADLGLGIPDGDSPWIENPPNVITLEADGSIFLDGALVDPAGDSPDLPGLAVEMKSLSETTTLLGGDKPLIVIEAADDALHQRLTSVLSTLAGAGLKTVSFRASATAE